MSTSGLRSTWHRLGIELPGHPRWLVAHPNARALTRDQAVAALERALEVGRDRVAEELGITRWTLTKNWHYWGLQGPGREHAATIRWRRVRAQEPPCRRSRPGSEGAGDPSRSAERLQLDDVNFVNGPGSGSARAHAMLTHDPAPTGIGDRIGNTTGPVHPS
jgi:hypothetical protein